MTQQEAWKIIRGVVYDHHDDLVSTLKFMNDHLDTFAPDTKIAFHVLYGGLKKVIK